MGRRRPKSCSAGPTYGNVEEQVHEYWYEENVENKSERWHAGDELLIPLHDQVLGEMSC